MAIDDSDRRLLRQLQADPRQSATELAARARMPVATCLRRLDKLRSDGVIRAQRAVINWRALGYEVEVSLRITLDKTAPRVFEVFTEATRAIAYIVEVQTFLGRVDVRLSVIARDMAHYQHIYRNEILALPHMSDIEALMHVAAVKYDETLPL